MQEVFCSHLILISSISFISSFLNIWLKLKKKESTTMKDIQICAVVRIYNEKGSYSETRYDYIRNLGSYNKYPITEYMVNE